MGSLSRHIAVISAALWIALFAWLGTARPQEAAKITWKQVSFAIVRYNDDAPKSWNLYHSNQRGVLLLRLWKRYLLINVGERQVYDVDPQKIKAQGDHAECFEADIPDDPIAISEWKERNVGPVQRIRFRLGEKGNYLEIQIPLRPDGKPSY